jgi:hypothetical protein
MATAHGYLDTVGNETLAIHRRRLMVVNSGVTQFRNLGNGLCLSAPGGDYTNSNQLTYVACTNSWTSQFMLP